MTEFEFDSSVARMLDRYAWPPERRADWQDVLERASLVKPRRPRRAFAFAAAVLACLTLGLATPLGSAIRSSVSDFSDWLAGTPGTPVSPEEQRAFDESNEKSWAAFPGSPDLRRLVRADVDGVTYDLLGFRSRGSLCLRVVASGEARGSTLLCAPVSELRHDDGPVRVVLADWPVGKGEKTGKIGFETYRAARAQVTAGIAADGVEAVELVDEQGSHQVSVEANAFLYVAERPDAGQRVTHIRARLADGRTVGVPFTVSPRGPAPSFGGAAGEPGGPKVVERIVEGGTIGWITRREERGEPLDEELRKRVGVLAAGEFGRLITPDPDSPKRIAVTIGERRFPHRPPQGPSAWYTVLSGGGGSSSNVQLDNMFPRGPFTFSYGSMGAGDQFATFAGLASDDVARLEIFTATGNRIDVPLKDNAYLAEVALARFPAKLVAYDAQGRVIGIEETHRDEGPFTVTGPPILDLELSAEGTTVALRAQRTKEGGQCWYARARGKLGLNASSCIPKEWTQAPLRVGTLGSPPVFVYGRARSDITRIELRYRDGSTHAIVPGQEGYVLETVPAGGSASPIKELVGLASDGKVVSRQRYDAPAVP
jgi:hypothetical protein